MAKAPRRTVEEKLMIVLEGLKVIFPRKIGHALKIA
jgi:hypothetical protein